MGVPNSPMVKSMLVVVFAMMAVAFSGVSFAGEDASEDTEDAAAVEHGSVADSVDEEPAVDADPVVKAREHFAQGQKAYEAKDFKTADEQFEKAYALKPHPSALKMIAECKLQLYELPAAVTIMEQLLVDSQYDKKKKLKRRLAKIKKKVGKLVIESTPEGAVVSLNGKLLDEKTPTSVYVNPGEQQVVLLLEKYEEQPRDVSVAAGAEETVLVDYSTLAPVQEKHTVLIDPFEGEEPAAQKVDDEAEEEAISEDEPAVNPTPEPMLDVAIIEDETNEPPKAFWAAAAIAGVGLVSGTVFGTMALRDEKDFEETGDDATRDSGKRAALIADISFGVAVGAAIAGVIVLISNKNKKEKAALGKKNARFYMNPSAGKNGAGFSSGFSF